MKDDECGQKNNNRTYKKTSVNVRTDLHNLNEAITRKESIGNIHLLYDSIHFVSLDCVSLLFRMGGMGIDYRISAGVRKAYDIRKLQIAAITQHTKEIRR